MGTLIFWLKNECKLAVIFKTKLFIKFKCYPVFPNLVKGFTKLLYMLTFGNINPSSRGMHIAQGVRKEPVTPTRAVTKTLLKKSRIQ